MQGISLFPIVPVQLAFSSSNHTFGANLDRLEQFESMLAEIENDLEFKTIELERLKAQGKEKSATFKQYLADKLLYQRMLSIYARYGLR